MLCFAATQAAGGGSDGGRGVRAAGDDDDGSGAAPAGLDGLREGARVGTSSIRRAAQLRAAREDLDVVAVGGNVDTRLRLLAQGEFDAIVLARAGLQRLGREGRDRRRARPRAVRARRPVRARSRWRPARGTTRVREAVAAILDEEASACLLAERAVAGALNASCHTPLGAYATPAGCGCLGLRAWIGLPDGSAWIADELLGGRYDPESFGRRVAERMSAAGARELLAGAEKIATRAGA